jgi:hypothetical protein
MSADAMRFRKAAVDVVLGNDGRSSVAQRRAAFANEGVAEPARALIDKVARNAWKVTDEDIAAVKAGGLSEDEIFELAVTASLGQATRQLDAGLAALDAALASAPTDKVPA